MKRTLNVLGVVAGVLMAASGAMHSLLGWTEMRKVLDRTNAPGEFANGLAIPWHFAGLSMLVFAAIVVPFFISRLRGTSRPAFPVVLIGSFYLLFTILAVVALKPDPFFAIFAIPGALVLLGLVGGAPAAEVATR